MFDTKKKQSIAVRQVVRPMRDVERSCADKQLTSQHRRATMDQLKTSWLLAIGADTSLEKRPPTTSRDNVAKIPHDATKRT